MPILADQSARHDALFAWGISDDFAKWQGNSYGIPRKLGLCQMYRRSVLSMLFAMWS